jgi:hypothetical protein
MTCGITTCSLQVETINRLHRLLLEWFPGGAKKLLAATIKPRDPLGKLQAPLASSIRISPSGGHGAALAAAKHVLCEKPFTANAYSGRAAESW